MAGSRPGGPLPGGGRESDAGEDGQNSNDGHSRPYRYEDLEQWSRLDQTVDADGDQADTGQQHPAPKAAEAAIDRSIPSHGDRTRLVMVVGPILPPCPPVEKPLAHRHVSAFDFL